MNWVACIRRVVPGARIRAPSPARGPRFDAQGRTTGDGPTIGLILCAEKNEAIARYSILHEHEQLFAAKYVTYLPSEEELERELARDRRLAETTLTPEPTKATKGKHSSRSKGRR